MGVLDRIKEIRSKYTFEQLANYYQSVNGAGNNMSIVIKDYSKSSKKQKLLDFHWMVGHCVGIEEDTNINIDNIITQNDSRRTISEI